MVTPSPGATTQLDINRAFTDIQDAKGKQVKFEQKKDTNPPVFEGKGSDGNIYAFSFADSLVSVNVYPSARDNKQLRKLNPGMPLPKEEAKKIDAEIKKEQEDREKLAEEGTTPEAKAMETRAFEGGRIGPQPAQEKKR